MEHCFGQYGWREFHRNRKDILGEFDKILEQTKNRPVQVAHGQGVEAYIRKWLSEFLPKKYAVTSGYIIPDLYDDSTKMYHFDIIIYNRLESPILWTEGNADDSEQGKFRAIPAKYVCAVYEVKSRLTKNNVDKAIEKLEQIQDFKEQLPPYYSCGAIFIELKEEDNKKASILEAIRNGLKIHGFWGGMVLRYEGDETATGLFTFLNNEKTEKNDEINKKTCTLLAKAIDTMNIW